MNSLYVEFIGWLGGFGFTVYSIPQTITVVKESNANGFTRLFLIMMFFGALFSLIYSIPQRNLPLIFNFSATLINSIIMLKYKFFKRKKN